MYDVFLTKIDSKRYIKMTVAINNYFFLTKKGFKRVYICKMIVVENGPTQDHFSKVSIYNYLGLKNLKKGYMETTKKNYLENLRSVLGQSIFHY